MYYRCISTCTISAETATSTPILVKANPLLNCYCQPGLNLTCGADKINDFSFANILNQSNNCDAGGYSDWTTFSFAEINVNAGNTYSFSVNTGSSNQYGNSITGVWIDYNQNAIFETNEFTKIGIGTAGTYTNSIQIPVNTPSCSVRMRLKTEANNANEYTTMDACSNGASFGQTLDYKVNITPANPCSGAPLTADAVSSQTSVCQNSPFVLDLTNYSIATNINYQWQNSTDGITWANLSPIQSTIPYTVQTQSAVTYYRCISTCTTSAPLSTNSNTVVVNQNPFLTCYCNPGTISCLNGAVVSNIEVAGITYTPACQSTDNFYDLSSNPTYSISLNANQTYTISADITSTAPTAYLSAWIDYNHNQNFDTEEYNSNRKFNWWKSNKNIYSTIYSNWRRD